MVGSLLFSVSLSYPRIKTSVADCGVTEWWWWSSDDCGISVSEFSGPCSALCVVREPCVALTLGIVMRRDMPAIKLIYFSFDTNCCHIGTAIKHPVPDRVKPSFVIFDICALWRECPDVNNCKWWLNPVWHRMLYSCTDMATLGVKGLIGMKQSWLVPLW